tara:strand:+ start:3149 stop:3364 length:216 start_codon:yes stop_codon:yes gene_type:complete
MIRFGVVPGEGSDSLLWGKKRVKISSRADRIPQQRRLVGRSPKGPERLAVCIYTKLEFIQIAVGFAQLLLE